MRHSRIIFLLIALLVISSCQKAEPEEKTVKVGSAVIFDYAAGFDNGTLFDTSFEDAARQAGIYNPQREYKPERAVIGQDPLLPALAQAMIGMKEGETKAIRLLPEEAYGKKIENSTMEIERGMLSNPDAGVGEVVIMTVQNKSVAAFVIQDGDEKVIVDLNHPLAGEAIQFAILVRGIE